MNKLLTVGLATAALGPFGCRTQGPGACDVACSAGDVCVSGRCTHLCSRDADCPRGSRCEAGLCLPGERVAPPVVERVAGASTAGCTEGGDWLGACLGPGLVALGHGLAGARWVLAGTGGQGSFGLAVASATDQRVELTPDLAGAPDLPAGPYALAAASREGETQVPVQLLKGDPGEPGPAGPPGPSGQLYRYDGTTVAATTPRSPDRIVMTVAAPPAPSPAGPYGEPAALPVDDERLLELCADDDGCTIAIGVAGYADGSGRTMPATLWGGPCRVSMTTDGDRRPWTVDESCSVFYALVDVARCADGSCPLLPGFYARYFGSRSGVDGLDTVTTTGDERRLLLGFKRACGLYESLPDVATGGLEPDDAPGLYFVASSPAWGAANYPPLAEWPPAAAGRRCVLTVDD